jgi:hypothetical protein
LTVIRPAHKFRKRETTSAYYTGKKQACVNSDGVGNNGDF